MPAIKFRGVDFIAFDTLLSDDERLVRDTARKFIEDKLIPIIEECNRAGRFPRELVKPMADLGFFGASLQGYGCAGMSNVEYGLVTQELERGDSGVRSFVSVQSALVMYPVHTFGSDEQKNTWLPAMQKGEKLGWWREQFVKNAGKFDFPIHKPIIDLTKQQYQQLWNGEGNVQGIDDFFRIQLHADHATKHIARMILAVTQEYRKIQSMKYAEHARNSPAASGDRQE